MWSEVARCKLYQFLCIVICSSQVQVIPLVKMIWAARCKLYLLLRWSELPDAKFSTYSELQQQHASYTTSYGDWHQQDASCRLVPLLTVIHSGKIQVIPLLTVIHSGKMQVIPLFMVIHSARCKLYHFLWWFTAARYWLFHFLWSFTALKEFDSRKMKVMPLLMVIYSSKMQVIPLLLVI